MKAPDPVSESRLEIQRLGLANVALRYALMTALLVVFIGPFVWMASVAVRETGDNVYNLLPSSFTLANFRETWVQFDFGKAFLNSVLVAVATVATNLLFCSMAAYPLARMQFIGSKIMFVLILSTLMIPFQLFMIPLFLLISDLQLADSLTAIVLPASVGAFGIYLLRQYYQTIPGDLEEAARIDGAGEFRIWAAIMLPLTRPAMAALAIFIFVQSWSNFLWPLIVLRSEDKFTLPIAVAKLSGAFVDKTQYVAAGSVIAVLPIIIFFFALQRFFLGGLTLGSVKG